MGIYGLVSANGFNEYLTGKDMFGNELTVEQQQNSLYQALGLLAVGGGAYYVNRLQAENAVYNVLSSKSTPSNKRSPNSFINQMEPILKKNGISLDEFNSLKVKSVKDYTDNEIIVMKDIRDSVPSITKDTKLQKTIPVDDVAHLSRYEEVVESLRLDYTSWNGNRPFPDDGNSYGKIIFSSSKVDKIDIPYEERFGGKNTDGLPCTLNGFTASRNNEVIPEWQFNNRYFPEDGAE